MNLDDLRVKTTNLRTTLLEFMTEESLQEVDKNCIVLEQLAKKRYKDRQDEFYVQVHLEYQIKRYSLLLDSAIKVMRFPDKFFGIDVTNDAFVDTRSPSKNIFFVALPQPTISQMSSYLTHNYK